MIAVTGALAVLLLAVAALAWALDGTPPPPRWSVVLMRRSPGGGALEALAVDDDGRTHRLLGDGVAWRYADGTWPPPAARALLTDHARRRGLA